MPSYIADIDPIQDPGFWTAPLVETSPMTRAAALRSLVLAYHHTRPFWETHLVVVPKRHIASFTETTAEDRPSLEALLAVVQRIAREVELTKGKAAVLTNLGRYQDSKHLHVHVHSGPEVTAARPS